jgi:probable rRNA maturation factor
VTIRQLPERTRVVYRPPWRIDVVQRAGIWSPISASAIVLTDDPELAELNLEHMGLEGATDVLSFPMLQPTEFPSHAEAGGRRTHIGDIAISVERAIEQAAEGRGGQTGDVAWSAEDELRLLVTHGTLHLCGHDHAEPGEELAMRTLERQLLEA